MKALIGLRVRILAAFCFLPVAAALAAESDAIMTPSEFESFLDQSLQNHPIGKDDVTAFYRKAFPFWGAHWQDYLDHPARYQSLLSLYYKNQALYRLDALPVESDRYKGEIENFKRLDAKNTVPANPVLFVGSSSIVFWDTAVAFPAYPVINRGFGGSTLIEVNHFYEDVVRKYHPSVIVFYCDNDIFMGKEPSAALELFKEFAAHLRQDLPATRLLFLSMKPTPMDIFAGKDLRHNEDIANGLIKAFIATQKNMVFVDVAAPMFREGKLRSDIFLPDGIHMNARGYEIWNPIVEKQLSALYVRSGNSTER